MMISDNLQTAVLSNNILQKILHKGSCIGNAEKFLGCFVSIKLGYQL